MANYEPSPCICFLSSFAELGGAELCLLDTIQMVRRQHPNWRVVLIVPADGALWQRARLLGVEVEVIPLPEAISQLGDSQLGRYQGSWQKASLASDLVAALPQAALYRQRLRRCWRSLNPQVIYANLFKAQLFAALSRPRNTRVVCHVHDYVSSRPIMARLFRSYVPRCDTIIANSKSVADDVIQILGPRCRVPIQVIYNSVDLDRFSPLGDRLDLDRLSGLSAAQPGTVRIGLVATMAWWKGHRTFLEAMARLQKLPVRGYLIGDSIYRTAKSQSSIAELRSEALQLGVAAKVGFTGYLSDIPSAIRGMDIVVHASTRPEPFGRALIEGMACAKPVITTGLGGAAEIAAAGPGTIKFWPGEPDDLAHQIQQLVRDPEARTNLGRAARQTAEQHFGQQQLAFDLELLWNRLSVENQSSLPQHVSPLEKEILVPGI